MKMKQERNRKSWRRAGGFSLLETIGVLAIIALSAAVLAPAVLKKVKDRNRSEAVVNLDLYSQLLAKSVLRTKTIPGPADMAAAVAEEMAVPREVVRLNSVGNERVFLVDPAARFGEEAGVLPYTQGNSGSIEPVSPRVLLLDSIGHRLPLTSGTPSQEEFDSIWNTAAGKVPLTWQWTGRGEDLIIQRIDLSRLFRRVIIDDLDPDRIARFSVDNLPPEDVAEGGNDAYYIDGTVFSFHQPDDQLDFREIINESASFCFERGIWRGQLFEGRVRGGKGLADTIDLFLAAQRNPGARFNAKPEDVVKLFQAYMVTFAEWSREGFTIADSSNVQRVPENESLDDLQRRIADVTANLIHKPPQPNP